MLTAIRTAAPADAEAVTALVESAYRGERSRLGWTTEADLLGGQRVDQATVLEKITNPKGEVLVCTSPDGHIVGCCELEHRTDKAYFGMFAVDPARQAGGLGKQLLSFAEQRAVERWPVTSIELTAIAQRTELLAWYARRGYRPTGETRPFPYGNPAFGLPQRDDLFFLVLAKDL